MSKFECQICLTLRINDGVCPHCNQIRTVCVSCLKKHCETSEILSIRCPNPKCMILWRPMDIVKVKGFNKQYASVLVKKQNAALLAKEKNTLDGSAYLVRKVDRVLHIKKTLINTIAQIKELQRRAEDEKRLIEQLNDNILMEEPSKVSIMRCRANVETCDDDSAVVRISECLGIIDEEIGCCLRCGSDVCMDCGASLDDDIIHECRADDIKDLAAFHATVKACPGCSLPIEKTAGCVVMYCIQCHTAFYWDSLQVTTGHFHNPEHQRLVVAGQAPQRLASGDGDDFLNITDISTDPSYPEIPGRLFILYGMLSGIFIEIKDLHQKTLGSIALEKELYRRKTEHRESTVDSPVSDADKKFKNRIIDFHYRADQLGRVMALLREIKAVIQEHLLTITSIAVVGIEDAAQDITIGSNIVYGKIATSVSKICDAWPRFYSKYLPFYIPIHQARRDVLPRVHPSSRITDPNVPRMTLDDNVFLTDLESGEEVHLRQHLGGNFFEMIALDLERWAVDPNEF